MDKELLNVQAQVFVDEVINHPETIEIKKNEVEKMSSDIINGNYNSAEDLREKSRSIDYVLNKMYELLTAKIQEKNENLTEQHIDITYTIQGSLMSLRTFVIDNFAIDMIQHNNACIEKTDKIIQMLRNDNLSSISNGKPGLIEKIKRLSDFTNPDKTNTNKPK